ncbi:precorrin-2/cobalt-factor-2 C20-methyltransferase [Tepidamorphus gemmatus]|uniref:Precorrin-2/cobalt-factor-2 C20-methyltransferase n=1 Tax=Tepidamorphus gemmatus TaxID=747076 RepID=A0A4R3MIV6_9HYPH|nr:precorrin-2 C(20)-methyltransferase [Tepidamorphus gemmatus]TCT13572.1 precorrin-2/cobalt-factor-2 C20-methyltransferase [Tepidamorphus gemmatus]
MTGTLYGVGVGPGDPELLTLKAARILRMAGAIAYFAKRGQAGNARTIVDGLLGNAEQLRLEYPFTVEVKVSDPDYHPRMAAFYDEAAGQVAARLDAGADVAVLCEGDPLFYGSYMYLHDRLAGRYRTEVVPGITAMSGCWSRLGRPMTRGDDVLAVVPGTLEAARLAERLALADAAVVMKAGRHLPKIRAALAAAGRLDEAVFVERGTMAEERILPLAEAGDSGAYFSLVLVPTRRRTV